MKIATRLFLLGISLCAVGISGCTQIVAPVDAIPAAKVPPQFLVKPMGDTRQIDFTRLRRPPEDEYVLDKGDVLGIFIDGVLGSINEAPPIRLPDGVTDLPPAIGYPVAVRDNGTLPLPLIRPIFVKGMTIPETEAAIKRAYAKAGVLKVKEVETLPPKNENAADDAKKQEGAKTDETVSAARTIVTLMKERTYRILVVRQDNIYTNEGSQSGLTVQKSVNAGLGTVLQLPEGKNDVLQALSVTGGLPGFRARNEVKIYRGGTEIDYAKRDRQVMEHYQMYHQHPDPCFIPPPLRISDGSIRIPIRMGPNETPKFKPSDVILGDGDIVVVESRDKEVFYTGGLLGGGEYPLPRDYDLDVLTAMSIARQGFGAVQQNGGGGGIGGQVARIPPGQLIVLRELPGNRQLAIEVDVTDAINNPKSRILVAPGDRLILRHKPVEEVLNFGLGSFFTFGIRQLFN